MQKIKIGFSTSNKIGAILLRWWMGRPFSHTYFEFKSPILEQNTVFHALGGKGLHYTSKSRFLKEQKVVKEFILEVSDEKWLKIVNRCHDNAGIPYGYWQNFGNGIAHLLGLEKNPFRDRGMNCSVAMAELILEIDPQAFQKDLALITPADVYDYLTNYSFIHSQASTV